MRRVSWQDNYIIAQISPCPSLTVSIKQRQTVFCLKSQQGEILQRFSPISKALVHLPLDLYALPRYLPTNIKPLLQELYCRLNYDAAVHLNESVVINIK